jgi:hypothetical protein
MSASEIIQELPSLTEGERRAVLKKLCELIVQEENVLLCRQAAGEGTTELDRLEEGSGPYRAVDLRARGIKQRQAADLRARMKAFAEDWDRPEATIYDALR